MLRSSATRSVIILVGVMALVVIVVSVVVSVAVIGADASFVVAHAAPAAIAPGAQGRLPNHGTR